ncbi:hypothetical protein FQZ97_855560 [compost metagenome]
MVVGVRVALTMQHDLATKAAHRIDLDLRRGGRHDDHRPCAQLAPAQRHALGMIAGRSADHAVLELLGREVRHLVVGAAQLETEDRLLVFALEQHRVVQPLAQVACRLQRRLHRHVIHASGQDLFQVVGRPHGGDGRRCRLRRFLRLGCAGGHEFSPTASYRWRKKARTGRTGPGLNPPREGRGDNLTYNAASISKPCCDATCAVVFWRFLGRCPQLC